MTFCRSSISRTETEAPGCVQGVDDTPAFLCRESQSDVNEIQGRIECLGVSEGPRPAGRLCSSCEVEIFHRSGHVEIGLASKRIDEGSCPGGGRYSRSGNRPSKTGR